MAAKHEARFLRFVDKTDDCWLWRGHITVRGYGAFSLNCTAHKAHRVAFELWNGPLNPELVVHHTCHNRACVNPAHLSQVTAYENSFEPQSRWVGAINARKTHCIRGHEFTPENTRITKRGSRVCRACVRTIWTPIRCAECGESGRHAGRGLCQSCASKARRQRLKNERNAA